MTRRHSIRGSTVAETAIVMTALLMIIFATIDFARLAYTYAFLTYAAEAGDRWAIVRGSSCMRLNSLGPNNCGANTANNWAGNYVVSLAKGIVNPAGIVATGEYGNGNSPGALCVIYVTYTFNWLLPYMPNSSIAFRTAARMHITN